MGYEGTKGMCAVTVMRGMRVVGGIWAVRGMWAAQATYCVVDVFAPDGAQVSRLVCFSSPTRSIVCPPLVTWCACVRVHCFGALGVRTGHGTLVMAASLASLMTS